MTGPLLATATFLGLAACGLAPAAAPAPALFFAPTTPYLSGADIPAGFYAGGQPSFLDTLEVASLGGGLTSPALYSKSSANSAGFSVDADDGSINGLPGGTALLQAGESSVSVASGPLPTAFGLVITSGNPFASIRFTAFDGPGAELGSVSYPGSVLFSNPATARARFVGVQFAGGIRHVVINAGPSIAFDHLQYGAMPSAVPEPGSRALMAAGLGPVALRRRAR